MSVYDLHQSGEDRLLALLAIRTSAPPPSFVDKSDYEKISYQSRTENTKKPCARSSHHDAEYEDHKRASAQANRVRCSGLIVSRLRCSWVFGGCGAGERALFQGRGEPARYHYGPICLRA